MTALNLAKNSERGNAAAALLFLVNLFPCLLGRWPIQVFLVFLANFLRLRTCLINPSACLLGRCPVQVLLLLFVTCLRFQTSVTQLSTLTQHQIPASNFLLQILSPTVHINPIAYTSLQAVRSRPSLFSSPLLSCRICRLHFGHYHCILVLVLVLATVFQYECPRASP